MLMPGLRDLDLRHLLALDAVATEGTFARAADRLGYTQSAISQQIASLERAVGERVFDRPGGPRAVELTPFGAELLRGGRDLLGRVGLAERAGHLPGELSGGERQRVAVARAMLLEPRLLLADEPTGQLDSQTADGVTDLLVEMAREAGGMLVVVTHADSIAARIGPVRQLVDGVLA